MNTNTPPTSSGSILEKAGRKQNTLPLLVAVFLAFHAVVLGGILWIGCKPLPPEPVGNEAPPPVVPSLPPLGGSNNADFFAPVPQPGGSPIVPSHIAPGEIISGPIPPPADSTLGMPRPEPPPVAPIIDTPTTSTPPPGTIYTLPRSDLRKHTVSRGDTYYSIQREYGTTISALKAANPGVDPTKLQLGHTLTVPAPTPRAGPSAVIPDGTYVVKSGDYLGKIADKHNTTVQKLREVNGLTSDRIRVGQRLKLPAN